MELQWYLKEKIFFQPTVLADIKQQVYGWIRTGFLLQIVTIDFFLTIQLTRLSLHRSQIYLFPE